MESGLTPLSIAYGLNDLARAELCQLLAILEEVSFFKIAIEKGLEYIPVDLNQEAFEQRVEHKKGVFEGAIQSTAVLRVMLWGRLTSSLGIKDSTPLSIRAFQQDTAQLAQQVIFIIGEKEGDGFLSKWTKKRVRKGKQVSFSSVVSAWALKVLLQQVEDGSFDLSEEKEITLRLRDFLRDSGLDELDEKVAEALTLADGPFRKFLLSGVSLGSLALAVDMAGFSAYIFAAKLSALLPFVSSTFLVSSLAVLTNPLAMISMLGGGGYYLEKRVSKNISSALAANIAALLALRGSVIGTGVGELVDQFRSCSAKTFRENGLDSFACHVEKVGSLYGGELSQLRIRPPAFFNRFVKIEDKVADSQLLYVAALTVSDLLYNIASIDPKVIAAADFSRAADLSDVMSFTEFAEHISVLEDTVLMGVENNLRGYVAEQLVASELASSLAIGGHQVSFPETSNQAGYDLLVDGQEFQVKCLSSVSGLYEHFQKYPDIPVIANAELVEAVQRVDAAWSSQVFFVEGYSRETVDELMKSSVDAASDLIDLDVPIWAMTVATARNAYACWKGEVRVSNLPLEIAVDCSIRGGLAATGSVGGSFLGAVLFGPAGAVVLGSAGGLGALLPARYLKNRLSEVVDREWADELRRTLGSFLLALRDALARKIELIREKNILIPRRTDIKVAQWLTNRFEDDVVFLTEQQVQVEALLASKTKSVDDAINAVGIMHNSGVHPAMVNEPLNILLDTISKSPSIAETAGQVIDEGKVKFLSLLKSFKR